jgi:hypothetical protein
MTTDSLISQHGSAMLTLEGAGGRERFPVRKGQVRAAHELGGEGVWSRGRTKLEKAASLVKTEFVWRPRISVVLYKSPHPVELLIESPVRAKRPPQALAPCFAALVQD